MLVPTNRNFSNIIDFQSLKHKLLSLFLRIKNKVYRNIVIFLLKDNILYWSIKIIREKLWFDFNALYHGITINKQSNADLYNFRRNIHRLEKGLSYPKTKNIFAEDYILETIHYLKQDRLTGYLDKNTKIWGEAVLNNYFQVCDHSEIITRAYQQYSSLSPQNTCSSWIPYRSDTRPKLNISYEDLYQLALRRRSVRFYLKKKVERDLIQKAFKIAALSPSACNRQAFKFLFFNEEKIVKKISEIPLGIKGFELPSIVIVIGSYRGYFDERDIHAPIIDSSLAVMSFLFALESLNLSSVCINWANLIDKEQKIRKIIDLEKDEFIVMLVGIGYPDPKGKIPFSAKKDIEEMLFFNQRIKSN